MEKKKKFKYEIVCGAGLQGSLNKNTNTLVKNSISPLIKSSPKH